MTLASIFGPFFKYRYSLIDLLFLGLVWSAGLSLGMSILIIIVYFLIDATVFQTIRSAYEESNKRLGGDV